MTEIEILEASIPVLKGQHRYGMYTILSEETCQLLKKRETRQARWLLDNIATTNRSLPDELGRLYQPSPPPPYPEVTIPEVIPDQTLEEIPLWIPPRWAPIRLKSAFAAITSNSERAYQKTLIRKLRELSGVIGVDHQYAITAISCETISRVRGIDEDDIQDLVDKMVDLNDLVTISICEVEYTISLSRVSALEAEIRDLRGRNSMAAEMSNELCARRDWIKAYQASMMSRASMYPLYAKRHIRDLAQSMKTTNMGNRITACKGFEVA